MRHLSLTGLAKIVENDNIQCWQGVTLFPVIIKNLKIKGLPCSLILTLPLTHYVILNKSPPLSVPHFLISLKKKKRTKQKIIKITWLAYLTEVL